MLDKGVAGGHRPGEQNDRVRLVLIRHAEPEAHIKGVVAGPKGCTGLTDRGRAQASDLADRLARDGEHFDVLYSSILPRAVETAAILGAALGLGQIRQDCDLCELHPGECDGMAWTDHARVYGSAANWGPDEPLSPGGESLRSFDRRVRSALDRLAGGHAGDSVAVVTHGGFITAAMLALLGRDGIYAEKTFVLHPGYTSLSEWSREHASKPWVLERYNDTGHLAPPSR
jgi:broad specificity phosphatase PhoE